MANHPNRSQALTVMPDEVVDLAQQKAARVLKFMSQSASLGMTDGMLRRLSKPPAELMRALFPGGYKGREQAELLAVSYEVGFSMGKLYVKAELPQG